MKKLICALLVATMLLGSVAAFAGTCNHKQGVTKETDTDPIDACHYNYIEYYYCKACGELVDTLIKTRESHNYESEIIDGVECQVCVDCGDIK